MRYATEAESAAAGLVLRVQHLSVRAKGGLVVRNVGTRRCFIACPDHCSVFVRLGDAQHRPLNHHPMDTRCRPGDHGPAVRLAPGHSVRYVLDSHADLYCAADLPTARTFEVVYQGTVSAQGWDPQRAQRIARYTLKTSGALDRAH